MTKQQTDADNKSGMSRRQFLKNSGLVAGGLVGGSLLGGLITNQVKEGTAPATTNDVSLQDARMFFDRKEDFDTLSAATERIFPKDKNGPGAIELSIPYFIDKQLAGPWGLNAQEYMKGPFHQNMAPPVKDKPQDSEGPNAETQIPVMTPRYQTPLNRGEIMLAGLQKMQELAQEKFKAAFYEAEPGQQDELLVMFDENKVDLPGVDSAAFFSLLKQMTIEGAYADPLYGGNKNMLGWKMKEYPGPRMGYMNDIQTEEFKVLEPESLVDYQKFG